MNRFNTLQSRIFLSMLILVIIVSISIIIIAILQYQNQAEEYHRGRLDRKEASVKRDIEYQLHNTTFLLITEKLPFIFKEKIFEMSHVHNLEMGLYDMQGGLLITSRATFEIDSLNKPISPKILSVLKNEISHRVVSETKYEEEDYLSVYSYIYDNQFSPIGVLHIPYLGKTDMYDRELQQLLFRISMVFVFAIMFSIALAYFSSRLISDPIKEIVERMKQTRLNKQNQKLAIESGTVELHDLINAYNGMIDEIEESAVKLARNERESAWREMAKQVAHEIKNPLTPMRLTVQSFERKFEPNDPNIKEKLKDFSESLIQQIDTMTSIASAFSDFAKMPTAQKEEIDVVKIAEHTLDIFSEEYISFFSEKEKIIAIFDKIQMVRIITNLVTNANQAVAEVENPRIEINLKELDNQVEISIADNGKGISAEHKTKIFEPKFTTKTSGMGLGLAMVKNILDTYQGTIDFVSEMGKGTVFTIRFPKK